MTMGFLRKRGQYYTPEPDPDPTLVVKPGGALVDPEWLAEEVSRSGEEQERRDFKAKLRDEEAARDIAEYHAEREAMERIERERMEREIPEHLRGRLDA